MQSKLVCEEFERKMWLFIDKSLTEEEMRYWERHTRECALCSSRLLEAKDTLSLYESIPMDDIEEETFNVMIKKAARESLFSRLRSGFPRTLNEYLFDGFFRKFAFGGMALSAVLVILFFMYKPESLPELKKYSAPRPERAPLVSQNIADKKETPAGQMRKTEVTPAKYEWKDRRTALTIRHVSASLARLKIKKENYERLDDWALQAMALKQKMEFMKTELTKSAM
ncbi:MAG: zf-HC2 domain-containing protein [Bacteroidota bacterium]|jgi:hypothetical protein|nr:zf-HC2 domain-containing protein [Ignavibacteria bacterium]MCU7500205.1 zf-HC2 domain-containing protein [Ignavibacteria bacterium]MCU7513865.1 zf-HC2 domain-containing protein [Ignavibacteria bacterium]MCU7521545.1 zf-HC2 domain-containing protein [Ignavibacteria bacterium]MCU7524999.1 zf-HC2 domain-containing protein [Ignavibacteria bacterium]